MGLQDLTPELRTRLSRVERAVAVFVALASILLVAGFVYYVYHTAKRKGWFETKAPFFTYVSDATGLNTGTPVKLMGFDVGKVTKITAEAPGKDENVYVEFYVQSPYIGYIWNDSRVRVISADFLGGRHLEVLKGGWNGYTNANGTKKVLDAVYKEKGKDLVGVWIDKEGHYTNLTKQTTPYWLLSDEAPALTRQAERLIAQAESALPNILNLTNQIAAVLSNSARVTASLNTLIANAQPVVTNIGDITARLRDPRGSLGEWLIPTNLNSQLEHTLLSAGSTFTNANRTLAGVDQTLGGVRTTLTNTDSTLAGVRHTVANTDTNVTLLLSNLNLSLESLAGITSNLNSEVQANTNILSEISAAVIHADELMQGLKRHWLLRSAFKSKTNKPPAAPTPPKGRGTGK